MKIKKVMSLAVVIFGFGSLVGAGTASAAADLEGHIELAGGNVIAPGTLATAVLTFKNNGPDLAEDFGAGTAYFTTLGYRTIEVLAIPETAPCVVRYLDFSLPPPGISSVAAVIKTFRDLGPGESFSCAVGITTYPEAPETMRQRFDFSSIAADPAPDNNFVFIDIRTRAAAIAVPGGSSSAALLLVIGLALTGMLRLRRRMLTIFMAAPSGRWRAGNGGQRT